MHGEDTEGGINSPVQPQLRRETSSELQKGWEWRTQRVRCPLVKILYMYVYILYVIYIKTYLYILKIHICTRANHSL
jgi:hypothetical protein